MDTRVEALPFGPEIRRSKPISVPIFTGALRLIDFIVIVCPGIIIYSVYFDLPAYLMNSRYVAVILVSAVVANILFQWFGLYSSDHLFDRTLRIDRVIIAWVSAFGLLLACAFALKISSSYSRIWVVSWWFTTGGLLVGGRLLYGHWFQNLARYGRFAQRTVIFGATEQGSKLAAHFLGQPDLRTNIVGFIDDRNSGSRVLESMAGHKMLGNTHDLVNLIRKDMVDQVLIALPWNARDRLHSLIYELVSTPVRIRLAPDLIGLEFHDRSFNRIAELPMMQIFDRPISDWSYVCKWIEDRVIALLALLFVAPLMIIIGLAIKLTSRGPVFFKQKRHGFNYDLFEVWKFRTMYQDMADFGGAKQATRDDPRVTPLGRFLRMTSMDELPQLINVLCGDMSIVGPRPHPVGLKAEDREFEEVVDQYVARHRVKPGITGWAQINGWRGETDTIEKIQRRVEYDLYYIDNWTIWFDILIILKTIFIIFKDDNAY